MGQLARNEKNEQTIQRQIDEYKSDLRKLSAAKALIDGDIPAIRVSIALENDNFLDYWIENNDNVIKLLDAESEDIRKLMIEANEKRSSE